MHARDNQLRHNINSHLDSVSSGVAQTISNKRNILDTHFIFKKKSYLYDFMSFRNWYYNFLLKITSLGILNVPGFDNKMTDILQMQSL